MDDLSELIVKRSWTTGAASDPNTRDLTERLVIVRDGKRVASRTRNLAGFHPLSDSTGHHPVLFFDGEKIQTIAADDHSEIRLKSSLEAALGIHTITG